MLIVADRNTATGTMIHSYLTGSAQHSDHSIHLLFSANRWEAIDSILYDISKGVTVIVDRYSFSGAVYSAAKDNPNLSLGWAWAPEIGLPKPDVTIFLHISTQDAAERGGFGQERYETAKMQSRVRELFGELFTKLGDGVVHNIDAGRSMDEVADEVAQTVLKCVKELGTAGSLEKLGPLGV